MFCINSLKKYLGSPNTYKHTLLDSKHFGDRDTCMQRCHFAAKFRVFVDKDHNKLPVFTGYLSPITDHINYA